MTTAYSLLWLLLTAQPVTLTADLKTDQAAGAVAIGQLQVVDGGYACRGGAALQLPTAKFFDPHQGTVRFWVQPDWAGDDSRRCAFFHLGGGDWHVTVFKTEHGGIRFVYKASPTTFCAVDLSTAGWTAGSKHQIEAGWCQVYDGLMLALTVDGQTKYGTGAQPLAELPEWCFIGCRGRPEFESAEAVIGGFSLTQEAPETPFSAAAKPPLEAVIHTADTKPFPRVHAGCTLWNSSATPVPFEPGSVMDQRFKQLQLDEVRVVGFSETWLAGAGLSRTPDGRHQVDWAPYDQIGDLIAGAGATPYVRLVYHVPRLFTAHPAQGGSAELYQTPADLPSFLSFMGDLVRHTNLERHRGAKHFVTSLNEPDLEVANGGDYDDVLELYAKVAPLVKQLDPTAKVGGPALAFDLRDRGEPYLRQFLKFCRERKLPVDFICYHGYRKAHPREYEQLQDRAEQIVAEEWPGLQPEYMLDEWNLWQRDHRQDDEYGAAYLAAALQYQRRAGVTRSFIVSFNEVNPTRDEDRDVKRVQGPYRAKQTGQRAEALELTAGEVKMSGLLLHPGPAGRTFAEFAADLPAGRPVLKFDSGIALAQPYAGMDGVGLYVRVGAGNGFEQIWTSKEKRLKWTPQEVDLSRYAGRSIVLRLETDDGGGNSRADWASWGQPRIESDGKLVLDLVKALPEAHCGVGQVGGYHYDDEAIRRSTGLPLIKGRVLTAPYYVWAMHARLGPQECRVELAGHEGIAADDAAGVTATRDGDKLTALCWVWDPMRADGRQMTLRFDGLTGPRRLRISRIDHDHSNAYTKYVREGQPGGDRYNLAQGEPEVVLDQRVDQPLVRLDLPNMSVSLVELLPLEN